MDLISTLYRINHWWTSGRVNQVYLYSRIRTEFAAIIEALERKRILSLIGPRRVGKSTLLLQTVDHLLQHGVDPKRVLFFSGDEPALLTENRTIVEVIEAYATEVLMERLEDLQDTIYVIIDEIHVLNDWPIYLKSYYDRKYPIKFVVSRSSSTHLFHGSRESLLGRIEDLHILPLSFWQFVDFYAGYRGGLDMDELVARLPAFSFLDAPSDYCKAVQATWWELDRFKLTLQRILKEYLVVGGYPEYFETVDLLLWQKRLTEDIISRGLYRDIVRIYSIKNPELLEKLLYFIAANSGQPHAFATIAQTLGVDTATVSAYLAYLSQAYLVSVQENYSTNVGKVIRKNKKLQVTDNGIRNAFLRIQTTDASLEGALVENGCVQFVRSYAESNLFDVRYWRDGQKEVDIVVDKRTTLIPIEVKYRADVHPTDVKGLRAFIEKFDCTQGMVVTKDILRLEDDLCYVPFWVMR